MSSPPAAMQRAALGDVSNLSPARRGDTIPSPFKKNYSTVKLAPPVCCSGPVVEVDQEEHTSPTTAAAAVVSLESEATTADRSISPAASYDTEDAELNSQQRTRTSSETNISSETETESEEQSETETECGSETDPYILTDDSLVSPRTATDPSGSSSSPTRVQQPARTPRRRSSRKALPIIFFGTPSASEHDKRAKYDSKLRERRLLRRDSLDLARRRTLTQTEVSNSVPAHLKSRGSEEDETQVANEGSHAQAPDDFTADETETRAQVSSEQEDEEDRSEEQVEEEEEEEEEPPSPCLRPTQIGCELPSLLPIAQGTDLEEGLAKETATESLLDAAPQIIAEKEVDHDEVPESRDGEGSADVQSAEEAEMEGERSEDAVGVPDLADALADRSLVQEEKVAETHLEDADEIKIGDDEVASKASREHPEGTLGEGEPHEPFAALDQSTTEADKAEAREVNCEVVPPTKPPAKVQFLSRSQQFEEGDSTLDTTADESLAGYVAADSSLLLAPARGDAPDPDMDNLINALSGWTGDAKHLHEEEADQGVVSTEASSVEAQEQAEGRSDNQQPEAVQTSQDPHTSSTGPVTVQPPSDNVQFEEDHRDTTPTGLLATPQPVQSGNVSIASVSSDGSPGVALACVANPLAEQRFAMQELFGGNTPSPFKSSRHGFDYRTEVSPSQPQRRRSARLSGKFEPDAHAHVEAKENIPDQPEFPLFDPFATSSSPMKMSAARSPTKMVPASPSMGTIMGKWADALVASLSPQKRPGMSPVRETPSRHHHTSVSSPLDASISSKRFQSSVLSASQMEVEGFFGTETDGESLRPLTETAEEEEESDVVQQASSSTSTSRSKTEPFVPVKKAAPTAPARTLPGGSLRGSMLKRDAGASSTTSIKQPTASTLPRKTPASAIPAPRSRLAISRLPAPVRATKPVTPGTAATIAMAPPRIPASKAQTTTVRRAPSATGAAAINRPPSRTQTLNSSTSSATPSNFPKSTASASAAKAPTARVASSTFGSSTSSLASSAASRSTVQKTSTAAEKRPGPVRPSTAKRVLVSTQATAEPISGSAALKKRVVAPAITAAAKTPVKASSPVKPVIRAAGPGWRKANAEAAAAARSHSGESTSSATRLNAVSRGPSPVIRGPSPTDAPRHYNSDLAASIGSNAPFDENQVELELGLSPERRGVVGARVASSDSAASSSSSSSKSARATRVRSAAPVAPTVTAVASIRQVAAIPTPTPAPAAVAPPAHAPSSSVSAPANSQLGLGHTPAIPMSAADLSRLTARNTRKNEVWAVQLEYRPVRIEGAKPPSPSAKIPRIGGSARLSKQDAANARANRAKKRHSDESEVSLECGGEAAVVLDGTPKTHRLAAGDAQTYETPVRSYKAKGVRWHKALFVGPSDKYSTESGLDLGERSLPSPSARPRKSLLITERFTAFDRHGNIQAAERPISPHLRRTRVLIQQLHYSIESPDSDEGDDE